MRYWIILMCLLLSKLSIAQSSVNFSYYKTITIQESQIPGSSSLTDFPVLISVTDNSLRTTANGGKLQNTNGWDIVFTNSTGAPDLSFQIESYTATTGNLVAWVRVPSVSATANTDIRIYYGRTGVSSNPSSNATWSSDYVGVYHLNNVFSDATSNGNNGTNTGSTNTTGMIGTCQNFNGSSQYVTINHHSSLNIGNGTFSAWIRPANVSSGFGAVIAKQNGTGGSDSYFNGINNANLYTSTTGCGVTGSSTININTWYYMVVTHSGSTRTVYLNGSSNGSNTSCTVSNDNNPVLIGAQENGTPGISEFFNGRIDEVRISNVAKSADWIAAEYNNQNAPSSFYSIGAEQAITIPTYNADITTHMDTEIWTKQMDDNYGTCNKIYLNRDHNQRGLIQFDLSTIPSNATILSASLRLVKNGGNDDAFNIAVHRLTNSWTEGTGGCADGTTGNVTWNSRTTGTAWGTAGGDFNATAEATVLVSGEAAYNWTITNLVQNWVNGIHTNHGLLVKFETEGGSNKEKDIASRETTTAADRPRLIVSYRVPLTVTLSATNVTCFGGNTGSVTATVTGGASPYTYAWNGGGSSATKGSLSAGSHTVTVTDAVGTTVSVTANVSQPAAALSPTITVNQHESCSGCNNASITASATGGTSPYTYNWGGGITTPARTGLTAGNYTVTVTDNAACTASATTTVNALPASTGFNYYKEIVIDHNRVEGSLDMTDFPMVFSLTDNDLRVTASGGFLQNSNGFDIQFTNSDGGQALSFEIEKYNATTGHLTAWVRIPTLRATQNTTIRLYFGKSGVTSNPSTSATWSSAYQGVYHFMNNTTNDASPNGRNGTNNGTIEGSGIIGDARDFDGTDDYIDAGTWNISGSAYTLSAWVRADAFGTDPSIIAKASDNTLANTVWQLGLDDQSATTARLRGVVRTSSSVQYVNSTNYNTNTYYYVAATYDGSSLRTFVNGNLLGAQSVSGSIASNTNNIWIGGMPTTGTNRPFRGRIDEARILNAARSTDWLRTEYFNQFSPNTFYTVSGIKNNTGSDGGNVLSGYSHRTPITIDEANVFGSSNHTNFPVLISITNNNIRTVANGGKVRNNNGFDIVFTDSDGNTLLNHQLETYTASNGTIVAWVRIPTLPATANKTIFMYYGNPNITTDQSSTATWESNYELVMHLNNSVNDNTNNTRTVTNNGASTATGKISGAYSFNGSSNRINITNASDLNFGNTHTISAWVNPSVLTGLRTVIGRQRSNSTDEAHWMGFSGTTPRSTTTGACNVNSSQAATTSNWQYLVVVQNGTNRRIYLNGEEYGSGTCTFTNDSREISLGASNNGNPSWGDFFNGSIDEARMAIVSRSADWIKTEYFNQNNPSSFYSLGAEESLLGTLTGYQNRIAVTIDNARVCGSSTITDLPILISISSNNSLRTIANGGSVTNANGFDIRFTDSDGSTLLFHELESYTASTGALRAWVRIPSLSSAADKTIYLYFGNPTVTTSTSSTSIWSSDYKGVWHLNGNFNDATTNGNSGSNTGTTTTTGRIGDARSFNGSSQYITIPYSSSMDWSNQVYMSAWVNISNTSGIKSIFAKQFGTGSDDSYNFAINGSTPTGFTQNWCNIGSGSLSTSTWAHVAYTGNGNTRRIYVNGTEVVNGTCTSWSSDNNPTLIGAQENGTPGIAEYFAGSIDEVRYSTSAKSADFICTEYNSQNNPATFYTLGNAENLTGNAVIWRGTTSNAWATGSNWSTGAVPASTDSIIIPRGTPNTATIAANATHSIKSLSIDSGAVFIMNSNSQLNISGNVHAGSCFTLTNGTIRYNGAVAQYIQAACNISHFNMTVENTSSTGVHLVDRSTRVSNALRLIDGNVYTYQDSLLLSNTAGDGTSLPQFSANSHVVGYFNRAITTNTQTYSFPVGSGSASTYYLAQIRNKNMAGTTSITAKWGSLDADTTTINNTLQNANLTETDLVFQKIAADGMWTIEPNIQPTAGLYDFALFTANIRGISSELITNAEIGILKKPRGAPASQWGFGGGTSEAKQTRLTNNGFVLRRDLNTFSDFGAGGGSGGGGLPIKLSTIDAYYVEHNNSAIVEWVCETEINNDYFLVQRSEDGITFETIGQVDGAGNSVMATAYQFIDEKPFKGINYYRLKQVDYDGKYSYTPIVSVFASGDVLGNISVFPNPSDGLINVLMPSQEEAVNIMVIDIQGNVIKTVSATSDEPNLFVTLNLKEMLPSGNYLVKISGNNLNSTHRVQVIKGLGK